MAKVKQVAANASRVERAKKVALWTERIATIGTVAALALSGQTAQAIVTALKAVGG